MFDAVAEAMVERDSAFLDGVSQALEGKQDLRSAMAEAVRELSKAKIEADLANETEIVRDMVDALKRKLGEANLDTLKELLADPQVRLGLEGASRTLARVDSYEAAEQRKVRDAVTAATVSIEDRIREYDRSLAKAAELEKELSASADPSAAPELAQLRIERRQEGLPLVIEQLIYAAVVHHG